MKITFQGAAKIVTGSCYLFEIGKIKFLVDCGMFQGKKEVVKRNYDDFAFDPKKIDFMLLTHAHLDHSGLIPKLVKHGFSGKIYTTSSTRDLCGIMLEDSAHIQQMSNDHENKRRQREGIPTREQLYDEDDAKKSMKFFSNVKHDNTYKITDEISVCFRKAGHILGSAMVEVFATEKGKTTKLVFSGDIGQDSNLIVENPEIIKEADYLFIESTYGNRLHIHSDKRLEKFAQVINDTYDRSGKLIIPVFAIERTQEIILTIEQLYKKKMIPQQKVFLDSPLAIKATKIFRKHTEEYSKEAIGTSFNFKDLECTSDQRASMKINSYHKSAIIMAGSGMCNAGRVRHHIKHGIWDSRNTILFVGYQAHGTLGEVILSGEKNIRMMGMNLVVRAKIDQIDSFSGHADQRMLLNWLKGFETKPKKVIVIHGEEDAADTLSQKISEMGMETMVPEIGQSIEL